MNTELVTRRCFLVASGAVMGWFPAVTNTALAWQRKDDSKLIYHSEIPPNDEPPLTDLVQSWITPNSRFYIRSHAPTPTIDAGRFQLSVEGMVRRPFAVTVAKLTERFPKYKTTATLTCAGNRREEHSRIKPVKGVPWQAGAIGNAVWDGVRLSDVLRAAEVEAGAKHVWFEGADQIEHNSGVIPFGASIPLEDAMRDTKNIPLPLIATGMNGESLPPDHGYPLRTVVPGVIGARSVKWLRKIIVSDKPSTNHYVATAYKLVTDGADEEWAAAPPLHHFALNSVLCQPARLARFTVGQHAVRGYALPSGLPDHPVSKVQLSTDGGKTWTTARFNSPASPLCWRLWTAKVAITERTREIIVRAADARGNMQPEAVAWNLKGYMFNAWHRTPVEIRP